MNIIIIILINNNRIEYYNNINRRLRHACIILHVDASSQSLSQFLLRTYLQLTPQFNEVDV